MRKRVARGAALWGGRFSEPPAGVLSRLNDSFLFDRELLAQDVAGSVAWAEALGRARVLSRAETARLVRGLRAIGRKGVAGIPVDASFEDVHSYVEGTLRKRLGPLAGKLHTGRSRNDQVATDFRLWLREALDEARELVLSLAGALAVRARTEAATPMPGYTHLKRAEPVTFGHWCLAYVEMLLRDADRLAAARRRGNECPLGSGALSGTPIGVDRAALAKRLGFDRPTANSLDGVSDRDTAAEYLFAASLLLVHLSRLGEDLIFFSSDECGFVALPDALATGSSRMPQKKNPDLLELARGHAGRAIGELAGLLAVLKGLPLAYDKDLQLDKEPAFRVRAVVAAVLPALTQLVKRLALDRRAMKRAAADDRLLATELADALSKRGIPFRDAHETVGRRVARAEAEGKPLAALGPGDGIGTRDLAALDVGRALSKRRSVGGASPRRVAAAALEASRRIADRPAGARGMNLPRGFLASGVRAGLRKKGADVALLVAENGANAAAIFTKNRFQAAPVVLSRNGLGRSGGRVRGVVVNAGCANAATGAEGMAAARRVRSRAAELLGCPAEEVFVASTGVIGVVLPDAKIRAALPGARRRLSASGLAAASRAILTTDVGPKVARASFRSGGRRGRLVGFAKGAGMIHPDMATMLAFVMTDAAAEPAFLKKALRRRGRRELQRDQRRRRHLDQRHGPPDGVRRARQPAARGAGRPGLPPGAHRPSAASWPG